jgi:hypothetical protein
MGCDIHSRAEVRNKETGQWEMVGPIFDYPWSSRSLRVTNELLDRIPDTHRDGYLLDFLDFQIYGRDVEQKDYYKDTLPEIPPGSPLADKIILFRQKIDEAVQWGRSDEGRKALEDSERCDHDPDVWPLWMHDKKGEWGREADLTPMERLTLRKAILAYRDDEEEGDYSYMTLSFQIMHGPGWIARYRDGDEADKDKPLYLEEAIPFWTPELKLHNEPLDSRNYSLFAILADVRNGSGFAGVDTGDRVEPISEPRGIPEDASAEVQKYMGHMGVDGHSHSYHTLRDLKAYDWDAPITYRGYVKALDYIDMKERGWPEDKTVRPPGEISGGISGSGIVCFTPDGFERWVELGYPFTRQPETGVFSADVPVSAPLVPEVPAETSALAMAPAFRRYHSPAWVEAEDKLAEVVERETQIDKRGMDPKDLLTPKEPIDAFRGGSINGVCPFVQVEWVETRRPNAGQEFWKMVETFERLVEEHGLTEDDVRVTFFFDN